MNRVSFNAEGAALPSWTTAAGDFIKSVLDALELRNWELSVLFCGNAYIKSLNAQYRNKDEPTDVLSFQLGETGSGGRFLAGDIVISLDGLEENTRFFKVPADEELRRLLVHGILHLAGHDHATNNAKEPMLVLQESILSQLNTEEKFSLTEAQKHREMKKGKGRKKRAVFFPSSFLFFLFFLCVPAPPCEEFVSLRL